MKRHTPELINSIKNSTRLTPRSQSAFVRDQIITRAPADIDRAIGLTTLA